MNILVAQGLGEPLRLAQIREDAITLSPLIEGMAQAKADIDGLLVTFATLGEVRQGPQRLLQARHRLPSGRAGHRLVARLAAVGDGLVPHLTPQGMVGQPFHLVGEPVGIALFDGRHNTGIRGGVAARAAAPHRPPRASGRA